MRFLYYCVLLILLPVFSIGAFAQVQDAGKREGSIISASRASIEGVVVESETGTPLPGANVFIKGTSLGTATDLNGKYELKMVPPGKYTLVVRYIGYKEEELPVRLNPGQRMKQVFKLEYAAVEGEEVIVTAQAEGQMAAINTQLSSNRIVNVVASDRIQEIPDANAAESLGRLPGINVLRDGGEGTKVSIRGVTPKFNMVKLNNVAIPSTNENDRSVDLTMISPNMLAEIQVIKTLTPDQEADAVGGVVNLRLKKAKEGLHYDFMAQGGYNEKMSSYKPYKFQASISDRFLGNKLGVFLQGNLERTDRGTDILDVNWTLQKEIGWGVSPFFLDRFNLIDRMDIRKRYGGSLILDYQLPNGSLMLSSIYSRWDGSRTDRREVFDITGKSHQYSIGNYEHSIDVFTNSLEGENDWLGAKFNYGVSYSLSRRNHPEDIYMFFVESDAFKPGYSAFITADNAPAKIAPFAKDNYDDADVNEIHVYSTDLDEENWHTNLDVSIPVLAGKYVSADLKVGGKYLAKTRSYDTDWLFGQIYWDSELVTNEMKEYLTSLGWKDRGFVPPFSLPLVLDPEFDAGNFLDGNFDFEAGIDLEHAKNIVQAARPTIEPNFEASHSNDYEGDEQVRAFYLMSELNVSNKLTVIPGIRYEYSLRDYQAYFVIAQDQWHGQLYPRRSKRSFEHWFPGVNIKYSLTPWMDLRFAKTRSIARPDFNYLVDRVLVNTQFSYVRTGNRDLKPALSSNWDAGTAIYSRYVGLFGINVFYKEISDIFYSSSTTVPENDIIGIGEGYKGWKWYKPFNNPNMAYIRGIELEWQTNFWYLPQPLSNIVFNVNYTKIQSETKYKQTVLITDYSTYPVKRKEESRLRTGRIIHQPDDMINMTIGYDLKGFSTRLSWMYQGNIIRSVGSRPEFDSFTSDYYRLDLQLSQKLPWKGLRLYLNGSNLLDSKDEYYKESIVNPIRINRQEYYGRVIEIGFRYVH